MSVKAARSVRLAAVAGMFALAALDPAVAGDQEAPPPPLPASPPSAIDGGELRPQPLRPNVPSAQPGRLDRGDQQRGESYRMNLKSEIRRLELKRGRGEGSLRSESRRHDARRELRRLDRTLAK